MGEKLPSADHGILYYKIRKRISIFQQALRQFNLACSSYIYQFIVCVDILAFTDKKTEAIK